MQQSANDILALAYQRAADQPNQPAIVDPFLHEQIEAVARNLRNRSCVRFLLATTLAKAVRPEIDIRKPYTEIADPDAYSGRTFDETYIKSLIQAYAFRNRNTILTPDLVMVGRPEQLYRTTLQIIDAVEQGIISAFNVLAETIRVLIRLRDEQRSQIDSLIASLEHVDTSIALSSEAIVKLVQQHLQAAHSSRLPVLIVAAVYRTVESRLGERTLPLSVHNAADEQTGSLGDLAISLLDDEQILTVYEMKTRPVATSDIDHALSKIDTTRHRVDNYIFVTTAPIDDSVMNYAAGIYDRSGGIEVVVLDCIAFLRHFLHLFHRLRIQFLDTYQQLVLDEPSSGVEHPLKVALLALRQAAESSANREHFDASEESE